MTGPEEASDHRTRGATLVEYALLVALVCLVLIGAIQAVSDGASEELGDRGDSIGHPGEAATTSTSVVSPSSTSSTSTSTTAPYSVAVTTACSGASGASQNQCTFALSPAPPAGAVVTWTIDPETGTTGVLPALTFTEEGERTVQATVDGVQADPITVECTQKGNKSSPKIDCAAI